MDSETTLQELKDIVQQFCEERDWDQFHTMKDMAIAMVTESSELLQLFRFKDDAQVRTMLDTKREAIVEELADVLYAVLRFAQLYRIDLTKEFKAKMNKNRAKYPVSLARGKNNHYTHYIETAKD